MTVSDDDVVDCDEFELSQLREFMEGDGYSDDLGEISSLIIRECMGDN